MGSDASSLGNGIYQYEHFDPPFSECIMHKEYGITLLCGGCHDPKTRGYLPLEIVKSANQHPKALIEGFWNQFYFNDKHPTIVLGSNEFANANG